MLPCPSMTDRRLNTRYPVKLPVTFESRKISGSGITLDLSSKGVFISTQQYVAPGTRLELKMAWPYLLDGVKGLQLVATGRVTRTTSQGFAVEIGQHQFKTVKTLVKVEGAA